MASYLRDEQLHNITVDAELIEQISSELMRRSRTMPEYEEINDDGNHDVFIIFTIRFDQKGYKAFTPEELLRYFNQASSVERILFQIESGKSLTTNRAIGSYLSIHLDNLQPSFLTVSSENETWMDGAFSSVKEIIEKHKNKNHLFRNPWVELIIQLFGVLIGFALSLWGASKIEPNITIENAFLISFLLLLLIFSNLWSQISPLLKSLLSRAFPNIKFHRTNKDRLHWLYQTIVGGVVLAGALIILNGIFNFIGKMLGAFVGINA